MTEIILFNKPYGVVCQFTSADGSPILADYIKAPGFYAAGRLDKDSEGLLVLTNDGKLQAQISSPKYSHRKTYLVQVENIPSADAIARLSGGLELNDGPTRPCVCEPALEPGWLWPRSPPVRYRASIPTSWLTIELTEGRNRQVRRMTAAVGHPTLRLIRIGIGDWSVQGLSPGQWSAAH